MSYTRLNYDTETYRHHLKESLGPGDYMLYKAENDIDKCFYPSPHVRIDKMGANECQRSDLIDLDSEMLNITRPATNCPKEKFVPTGKDHCKGQKLPDCDYLHPESTLSSNPPCTLRGSAWNRWEWHCQNEQDHAIQPFDRFGIANRTIFRDAHRACIPVPLDQTQALPSQSGHVDSAGYCDYSAFKTTSDKLNMPEAIPSTSWASCETVHRMIDGPQ
jgi:hypothetical protein